MIPKIVTAVTLVSALLALATAGIMVRFSLVGSFPAWFLAVFLATETLLLLAVLERRAPVFGPIFWRGAPGHNRIALSFDDGPNEPFTSQVVEILKDKKAKATFFVIGDNCARFPEAVKRLADEGFEIGNHTWTHDVLPLKPPSRIREEIEKTSELIANITGRRPALFRAPHGWRNPWVNGIAREQGCTPVAWTLGVWDTDRPGAREILHRTLKGATDGCILLLHDGRGTEHGTDSSQLVEALPGIIDELRRRGFEFVTIPQMLDAEDR